MKPMCKLHSTQSAQYVCYVCGFMCRQGDETQPTHSIMPITEKLLAIWKTIYDQQIFSRKLKLVRKAKSDFVSKLIHYIAKIITNLKSIVQKKAHKFSSIKALLKFVKVKKKTTKVSYLWKKINTKVPMRFNAFQVQPLALSASLSTNIRNENPTEAQFIEMTKMAASAYNQAEYNLALQHYNKALSSAIQVYSNSHTYVASICINMGNSFLQLKDYDNMIYYYDKALQIYLKLYGKDNAIVAEHYYNIGKAYELMNTLSNAIQSFSEALQIYVKLYGKQNAKVAEIYFNIGIAYGHSNNVSNALSNCNEAIFIFTKVEGEASLHAISIYHYIGNVLINAKDYQNAIKNYNDSLQMSIKAYGKNNVNVAQLYNLVGVTYSLMNCLEDAMRSFTTAALIYFEVKQFDEMCKAFKKALDIRLADKKLVAQCQQDYYLCMRKAFGESDYRVKAIKSAIGDSINI